MSERQLDYRYVSTFLKNVGVRIKEEPAEYIVMRRDFLGVGPANECRSFDNLREAFIYGLQLGLLPPFFRHRPKQRRPKSPAHNVRAYDIRQQQAEVRRYEIEAENAAAASRRETMIHAELSKFNVG